MNKYKCESTNINMFFKLNILSNASKTSKTDKLKALMSQVKFVNLQIRHLIKSLNEIVDKNY